jgi:hypothetical protein
MPARPPSGENVAKRGVRVKGPAGARDPGYTASMAGPGRSRDSTERSDFLYFFPDQRVTAEELLRLLGHGSLDQRAWAISHLLRYAQWDDIWTYVSREEVKEIFPILDLPENLRQAWGRMLKIEAPVG